MKSGENMTTKSKVLSLLEKNKGYHISGESMAQQLGVSRNAVWKAIKELEKDGHLIEAVTKKGYVLSDECDVLSVEGIRFHLREDFSHDIYVYDKLESTNKTAKEMAMAGAKHGTVVIANEQTAGRGRFDRKFHSPANSGIYMSIILKPNDMWLKRITLTTLFAAICVCEVLEETTKKEPKIKWVNDIFLNGLKICGILTEAVMDFESGEIGWVVVGIGINISVNDFPVEINNIAGVVYNGEKQTVTRNNIIAEVIKRLTSHVVRNEAEIIEQYKKRLFIVGKKVLVNVSEYPFEAEVIDVGEEGQLLIKKENGEIVGLTAGEVSIIVSQKRKKG